jgi:dethiobiotin synthetase
MLRRRHMRNVVVVAATNTGVGKTWVAARVIERLRAAGETVAARKPVQSFDPADGATDADLLAGASGESQARVCSPHRSYELAMAPPMAAAALGRPPYTIADLVHEMDMPETGVVVVEGVGGPASPLADDGDTVALAHAVKADSIIVVAPSGLGAINAVRLSGAAFAPLLVTVFLNRFDADDDLHRANRAWLSDRCGLTVDMDVDSLVRRLRSQPAHLEVS